MPCGVWGLGFPFSVVWLRGVRCSQCWELASASARLGFA